MHTYGHGAEPPRRYFHPSAAATRSIRHTQHNCVTFRAWRLFRPARPAGDRHINCKHRCIVKAGPSMLKPDSLDKKMLRENRRFYDALWSESRLVPPHRFNTWPLVSSLLSPQQMRLEVAPGLRPRLPIEDTLFLDISAAALSALHAGGARVMQGQIDDPYRPAASISCAHST